MPPKGLRAALKEGKFSESLLMVFSLRIVEGEEGPQRFGNNNNNEIAGYLLQVVKVIFNSQQSLL